ncbi:hypothetical protein HUJ05_008282 [Dendroctonus ponderosae]|nr:hypothetical protein HUJ05_008282 [Dendroctonus ponderosae]
MMARESVCYCNKSKSDLEKFDYDLIVLGGGSGGLSAAKEAADLGAKVAIFDCCANAGDFPKKIMHQAALFGEAIQETDIQHNWRSLENVVQKYVKTVKCALKAELARRKIVHFPTSGSFKDPHTILPAKSGHKEVTGKLILIALEAREQYPDIPGDVQLGITTEDLFSREKSPGKTLIIGAGCMGLECAGFLNGLGYNVTVMNRSAMALKRLDQSMASHVVAEMEQRGVKFLSECQAKSITKSPDSERLQCTWVDGENQQVAEDFDTVLFAIGRKTYLTNLNLEKASVRDFNADSGHIQTINEQTNVPHIFAVGDVLHDKPQMASIALQAGKLLSRRLFACSREHMDYEIFGFVLFTPLEYGAVGLTEESALSRFGEDSIEVYHAYYKPSSYLLTQRSIEHCYLKVVALREGAGKILGMHFLGPNAGEVVQGFVTAMRCGLTVESLLNTVGIHITNAEEFIKLDVTKRSGLDPKLTPCCS